MYYLFISSMSMLCYEQIHYIISANISDYIVHTLFEILYSH